jgi:hypothetical protein
MNSIILRLLKKLCRFFFDEADIKQFVVHEELEILLQAQRHIYQLNLRGNRFLSKDINGIVFSMDRALQLHALLGSYVDLVAHPSQLKIIYRASSAGHNAAYQEVFSEHARLIEVKNQETRKDFKELLIHAISESVAEHVFFLVDDNMFVEPVDLTSFANQASPFCVPSLRMGQNLSKNYPLQRSQAVPHFGTFELAADVPLLAWLWKYGELDWKYPLSLDGHIFKRMEILALVKTLDFDSPNRLEEKLQKFQAVFSSRLGVCYAKSRLVNIPYNRVNTDIKNRHGSVHQENMLRIWNEGYRIDRKSYYGIVNDSAHQEFPLHLTSQEELRRA